MVDLRAVHRPGRVGDGYIDHGHPLAGLGALHGRPLAAGAAADHDDVVAVRDLAADAGADAAAITRLADVRMEIGG